MRSSVARGVCAALLCTVLGACGASDTAVPTTTLPPSTTEASTTVPGATWEKVDPPTIGDSTDAVVAVNGTLADGRYWATVSRVSGSGDLVFIVTRAYFGDACTKWAAERGMDEGCPNDYAVDDTDTALVAIADDAEVSIAAPIGPGTNYAVSAPTLDALITGTGTSPVAGYEWVRFPFVVKVADGVVTQADQFWVP